VIYIRKINFVTQRKMIDSRTALIIANYMLQIHHDHCKLQCNITETLYRLAKC